MEQGSIYYPPKVNVVRGVLTPSDKQIPSGSSSAGGRETSGWEMREILGSGVRCQGITAQLATAMK